MICYFTLLHALHFLHSPPPLYTYTLLQLNPPIVFFTHCYSNPRLTFIAVFFWCSAIWRCRLFSGGAALSLIEASPGTSTSLPRRFEGHSTHYQVVRRPPPAVVSYEVTYATPSRLILNVPLYLALRMPAHRRVSCAVLAMCVGMRVGIPSTPKFACSHPQIKKGL